MTNKYCPECGGEYQEWAEKCVDCGVLLTDTKPDINPKKKKSDSEAVTVGKHRYVKEPLVAISTFATTLEAQFSRGILESEGIPSMITDADSVILNGRNTSTVHGVSLVVKESDATTAKEILDSIQKDVPEDGIITEEIQEEVSQEDTNEREPG
jgi:hypothetical protein